MGILTLHECVKLCRKKMLLIHFYKTQRSILHTSLLRNLKRQCNWLQPMISHTYYLPTLISAPSNLAACWSLLSIFTSATGSTRPRSTLHQGSLSVLVCVHVLDCEPLFPSTALLAYLLLYVLDWEVGLKRAILLWTENQTNNKNYR